MRPRVPGRPAHSLHSDDNQNSERRASPRKTDEVRHKRYHFSRIRHSEGLNRGSRCLCMRAPDFRYACCRHNGAEGVLPALCQQAYLFHGIRCSRAGKASGHRGSSGRATERAIPQRESCTATPGQALEFQISLPDLPTTARQFAGWDVSFLDLRSFSIVSL